MEGLNYCDEQVIRFVVTSSRGLSTKCSISYTGGFIDMPSYIEIDQDTLESINRYNRKKVYRLPYLVPIHECIQEIHSNVLEDKNPLLMNLKRQFTSYMALRKINRELRLIEKKEDELKQVLSLVGLDESDYLHKRKLIQELRESDEEYIRQLKEQIDNHRKEKEQLILENVLLK
ncbi:hypothetical protein [Turicibacter sanguinis]|jgi:hypothetical protein|uniref:hypothetical protein n=1 Tax=Turicibacter sanguinis TaxID=154288 RepID=UPI00325B94CE